MNNTQSNSARFIYTLNYIPNKNNIEQCKLKNGLYFSKESRSDEKIRFTESDMYSLVRTVLFMHVYHVGPEESIVDIVNTGEVSYAVDVSIVNHLTVDIIIELLDSLFGDGFARIVRRVVIKCYNEYCTIWKYYPYNPKLHFPSAADYINLAKFVNITECEYAPCELFIITNSTDYKIPLQQMLKILN